MVNTTDELELLMEENRHSRDCCVTIITETWLHLLVPDAAVQQTSRTMHKQRHKHVLFFLVFHFPDPYGNVMK